MTIKKRLWLSVTALLGLALLGNGLLVIGIERRELRSSFLRECKTFARLAGPQSLRVYGESGMREDLPRVRERVFAIAEGLPYLHSFAIVSDRGKTLLTYPPDAKMPQLEAAKLPEDGVERAVSIDGEEYLELFLPLKVREGGPEVVFQLIVSDETLRARLWWLGVVYGASFFLLLALVAVVASLLAGAILRPVEELRDAAVRIKGGDLSARTPWEGTGEMADLSRAFNDMAGEVEAVRKSLEEKNSALGKAYAELQAMQDELVALERMAAVGRTAAAVSHEIDNPIGVIMGTAQMLCEELKANETLAEDAKLIEDECKRVRRIVRDLLDFARPASRASEPLDLVSVVGSVLKGLSHHPQFKKIVFNLELPKALPEICADADGLRQVFLNLFINSAKAMDYAGTITVRGEASGDNLKISITDEGSGIAPENMEKVFEPFFTTKTSGVGSGLGLWVSRRIIEEHGGRLYAKNNDGRGAEICFELPLGL